MGHTLEKTELETVLKERGVTDVFVGGEARRARARVRAGSFSLRVHTCVARR